MTAWLQRWRRSSRRRPNENELELQANYDNEHTPDREDEASREESATRLESDRLRLMWSRRGLVSGRTARRARGRRGEARNVGRSSPYQIYPDNKTQSSILGHRRA